MFDVGFWELTFLATLALLVLGLKGAGMAVGWGIQFQQPLFLVALVLVLTLFAWNLFGLFEFHLPRALGGLGAQGDDTGACECGDIDDYCWFVAFAIAQSIAQDQASLGIGIEDFDSLS